MRRQQAVQVLQGGEMLLMRKSKYNSIFQGKQVLGKRRICLLCGKQQQSCFLASVEVGNENEPFKGGANGTSSFLLH